MGALSAPERVKLGSGIGGAFELALGVRLLVFTLGPRARFMVLSDDKTLWQLGAEAAFHIPLGRFEPFVGMQGGYTFGSSSTQYKCAGACPSRLSFGGADVGLGGGADYYLTPQLSLGGAANVMFLFLSRKAVDGSPDPAFASSESMIGLGATLGVHAAFHL